MKVKIIAIGHKMVDWVDQPAQIYLKRLSGYQKIELIELPNVKSHKSITPKIIVEKEGESILNMVDREDYLIAFDRKGMELNSLQLSKKIETFQNEGRDIVFIIGGAEGLSPTLLKTVHESWSLSKLTLPHGLARLLVIEQLYRAYTIIQRHPYHR